MNPRRKKRGRAIRCERAYVLRRAEGDPDYPLSRAQTSATLRIANLEEPIYRRRMVSGDPAISLLRLQRRWTAIIAFDMDLDVFKIFDEAEAIEEPCQV